MNSILLLSHLLVFILTRIDPRIAAAAAVPAVVFGDTSSAAGDFN